MSAASNLVTAAELADRERGALPALAEDAALAASYLAAAQALLASVLGYDPLVHRVTRYRPRRWRNRAAEPVALGVPLLEAEPWEAYGPTPAPVVQASAAAYVPAGEASDYYTVAINADGAGFEVAADNPLPPALDLYEGWRGSHHVLTSPGAGQYALTALPGLSGLTTLPPEVPEALRAALCAAAVYLARQADRLGVVTVSTDVGAQVRTVETLAAANDVNTLIGRAPEAVASLRTAAFRYIRRNA